MQSVLKSLPFVKEGYGFLKNILKLYATKSYSQEGEDLILKRVFDHKKSGFYVDIGAHHPFRFSNTYLFYKRGWRGINIDAMPNSMDLFDKYRPRDTNLEIPVGRDGDQLFYYIFEEKAVNTLNEELAKKYEKEHGHRLQNKIQVTTRSLKNILDDFLPKGQTIDFMSIDAEELDFDIIESNDWKKYRPNVLLVEVFGEQYDMQSIFSSRIYNFLFKNNYRVFAKTYNTLFFKDMSHND